MNILLGGLKGYEKTFDFFHLQKNVKFGKGGKTGTKIRYYSIEYFHRKLIVHFVKQQQKFFDLNNLTLLNFTLAANIGPFHFRLKRGHG